MKTDREPRNRSHHGHSDKSIEHKVDVIAGLIESLEENTSRYKEVQRIARLGHWILDHQSGELFWSDEIYRIFEIDPDAFGASYEAFLDAIHPEDRDMVRDAYSDSLANHLPYEIEHRLLMKDGAIKWVREACQTIFAENNQPVRSTGTVQDISERRRVEERIRLLIQGTSINKSELFFPSLTRSLAAALNTDFAFVAEVLNHEQGKVRMFSLWNGVKHEKSFEYEVKGTPCEYVIGKHVASFPQGVQELFPQDQWLKDENIESYLAIPLRSSHGDSLGHMGVLNRRPMVAHQGELEMLQLFANRAAGEIERKNSEESMRRMANYDQLTSLPNSATFFDRLENMIAGASRNGNTLAVFFLDLDGFKAVNDTLGHAMGDSLLKDVALCLKGCLREEDTVARIGGDEFAIILAETGNRKSSATVAEKIIHAMQASFGPGKLEPPVGISIGIAHYPDDGSTAEKILKQADIAMYHIKAHGKNSYQFSTASHT